jgi:DNA repair protein RadC
MNLCQVVEVELTYNNLGKNSERPKIGNAEDAFKILLAHWDENKLDFVEQSKILLLNRNGQVLGLSNISSGGINETVVDLRLIFVAALKANASAILLAHNHPSGNLKPSTSDRQLTNRLMDAGKLLQIDVLDHVIVTSEGYYSFAEDMAYEKVQRGNAIYYEVQIPF